MAQNESYQPGTWISKKMSSTFLAKSPSSKKKNNFLGGGLTSFQIFSKVNMSSSSLNFQGKKQVQQSKANTNDALDQWNQIQTQY